MISQVNASAEQFLASLDRSRMRAERAQQQMSSGRRVSVVSDDPQRLGSILSIGAELQHANQVGDNLSQAKAEVDTGEQSLELAQRALDRAKTIALNGATSLRSATERSIMANEVKGILEQMVTLADTAQAGRYLFSGDSEHTAPYQVDLSQANGVTPYGGSAATRRIEDASGLTFPIGVTAEEVFDAPGNESVFAAVNQLRVALAANDETGIQASLSSLSAAREHLSVQLARFGNMQNNVNISIDAAERKQVELTTALSGLADADMTESVMAFQNATLQQQATLSARAMVPRKSLFDYLG